MLIEDNGILEYGEIRINYLKVCQDEPCSTSVTPLQLLVCLLFLLNKHPDRRIIYFQLIPTCHGEGPHTLPDF